MSGTCGRSASDSPRWGSIGTRRPIRTMTRRLLRCRRFRLTWARWPARSNISPNHHRRCSSVTRRDSNTIPTTPMLITTAVMPCMKSDACKRRLTTLMSLCACTRTTLICEQVWPNRATTGRGSWRTGRAPDARPSTRSSCPVAPSSCARTISITSTLLASPSIARASTPRRFRHWSGISSSAAASKEASSSFSWRWRFTGRGEASKPAACLDRAVRSVESQKNPEDAWPTLMAEFRAETEAVLAGPAGELPAKVFAPAR